MTFYLCLGGYSGFKFSIDARGIRLSLGFLIIGASAFHFENALIQAANELMILSSENYILHTIIKEKMPEEYNKMFPNVPNKIDSTELN